MKYLIILLILFSSLSLEANLEKRYIDVLALTFQGFEESGGEAIWPGFQLADRAAVFHFKNGHVYAFGLKEHSSRWEMRLIQRYPVLFCPRYPFSLAPLQPDLPFENQTAFVFSLDHGNYFAFLPLLTFVHERFHLHQFQFFNKERVVESVATDYQNVDILAWMELEQRLLALFLQAREPTTKLEHLKDYLAVSQTRRQFLHSASLMWEDHQQKMEGLADYVSVKTFEVFSSIPDFNVETILLEMRSKKLIGVALTQNAIKGRHYFVGAVVGWALDFCRIKHWKWRIEHENLSLQSMLEAALGVEEKERQARLLHVQTVMNWNELREQILQQLDSEQRENEEVMQAFAAQEGVVFHIGMPSGHMSSGGGHQKLYQVDRLKALVEDTSLSVSQDQSWKLCFSKIPLVFEEPAGDRIFKLNQNMILQLDEKEITLNEMMRNDFTEMPFSSLSFKNEYCELDSKRSGKLCIEKGKVYLKFN